MTLEIQNSRFSRIYFSSITCKWATPDWLFKVLDREFHFTLDVCASAENAKCERFFTEDIDGLTQNWSGSCWMNPPYGRKIHKWIKKAYGSAIAGAVVVCLLPAKTDTRWFHDIVTKSNDIRFIKRRLKFGGADHDAPFPSMVVVFSADTLSGGPDGS